METSGTDAAVTYLGKDEDEEEEGYYELEHLPPLLEDEENVSLADVLSLRDSCMSEEEVWAVCAECILALQSIGPSHLFRTLCITPDTLAFNAHGNVCFMEQVSDDPEGSFVPPEFDNTGGTFEGHVYSLGCTLSAALDFVIEPELEAELGEEAQRLLEQMQYERAEDRPLSQDILSLAEARLSHTSSAAVCRKLSSIGRRVLSIESVSAFQDGQEGSWEARWQHPKTKFPFNRLSSEDDAKDPSTDDATDATDANGLSRQYMCGGWDSSLCAEGMDGGEGDAVILRDELDCRSQNSSPVRRRAQQRSARARGAFNRSCSVPDSNNPHYLPLTPHGDISVPVSDLTEIGAEEHLTCKSMWSNTLQRLDQGKSCESYECSYTEECGESVFNNEASLGIEEAVETLFSSRDSQTQMFYQNETQDSICSCISSQDPEVEHDSAGDPTSSIYSLYIPNNHMTKSMLCLNQESQDEWISLRELLTRSGRRLSVNELWALCYTCLSTLQSYIDFPAYLCLDTVYVGCEGEVLFLKPKNIGSCDAFYLAPEFQEHGIVTEKVCVYGVAAILWATAKFSLSPNQKLAMPRKLKRLLLEMAKRTPIERPSIVMAEKSCRDYFTRQGTNAETVWTKLINRIHQPLSVSTDGEDQNALDGDGSSSEESAHIKSGFVPTATENRLAPVPGPVPHSYPVHKELQLPEAFTSTATHFTPIILTQEGDSEEGTPMPDAAIAGTVDEVTRSSDLQENALDTTVHYEDLTFTQPETDLHRERQDYPANQSTRTSTVSSGRTLISSPSTSPELSSHGTRVSLPQTLHSHLTGSGVFNNYLLHQDPKTGHLTLVPVQITSPQSIPRLELNLPLIPNSIQGQTTHPGGSEGLSIGLLTVSVNPRQQEFGLHATCSSGGSGAYNHPLVPSVLISLNQNGETHPRAEGEDEMNGETHPGAEGEDEMNGETHPGAEGEDEMNGETHPGAEGEDEMNGETHPRAEGEDEMNGETQPGAEDEDEMNVETHPGAEDEDEMNGETHPGAEGEDEMNGETHPGVEVEDEMNGETHPGAEGEDQMMSKSHEPPTISSHVHPALQKVISLLNGELAFDGYLENGLEDLGMGEYILSLKELQYQSIASVVKEKFSDLYREEDLLGVLQCLVNYSPAPLGSNEQPPSKALQRAATTTSPSRASVWREKSQVHLHGCLDLKGNVNVTSDVTEDDWKRSQAQLELGQTDTLPRYSEARPEEENQLHVCQGVRAAAGEGLNSGTMEGGDHPAGGSDESPSEADSLLGREMGPEGGPGGQISTDCSEDMEDSNSLVSEQPLSPGSRAEEPGICSSLAWALAFWGEDCFSQEVVQYALNLGQHVGSPSLDMKTQELQQQLMIETRNLKKTIHFYKKLIQQDRKNKGSENKLMLSKLKNQLEELRYRVDFLDSVRKYLEVLSVEQWGVDLSLLPSLAACGPRSLDLQPSEDPAVLSFGNSRGKSTLLAGSPLGLMAYLYARNAALEGFIQQFFYSYRYFCTPEDLLQFLMDRFISAAAGGSPDMSGTNTKICHRSLDLLQAWLTDCLLVDFTPKSNLLTMLENFLNTEVVPVDSRGEALLATLHSFPRKRWSQGNGSPVSIEESDDSLSVHSLCRKSSIEDAGGKKSFQWRISRVVEPSVSLPKEKAFSIASALPRPCYSTLMDNLSAVCLRSEERHPFSQSEHSAQHTAQQLTLLQQEIFQGCHPVHFLNSRTQGVRDNVLSPSRNVSQHVPPVVGSSLVVCEGTPADSYLHQLLTYADSVTNWISAEIVICDSIKTQVALLTKFLLIGKHCYESRNFATAMQVLGGLENVIVRQLPAWKHLSTKVCEILEELRAVQVFLKSDDLCLMGGEHQKRRPTLPSAHILAMHIQQLEIGAFILTTGAYKWTKLRSIAKVVSQVHAFQEALYPYSPDRELQAYLRLRISHLSDCDIHLLAADNDANFQLPTERQTRRIQDTLRRVKATFQ